MDREWNGRPFIGGERESGDGSWREGGRKEESNPIRNSTFSHSNCLVD